MTSTERIAVYTVIQKFRAVITAAVLLHTLNFFLIIDNNIQEKL